MGDRIQIRPRTGEGEAWASAASEYGAWWHQGTWMDYLAQYCDRHLREELSFLVFLDDRPAALCPLFHVSLDNVSSFSIKGGFTPAPILSPDLTEKQARKVEARCFEQIDELARRNNVACAMTVADPVHSGWEYNHASQFGYLDASSQASVLDLSIGETALWADLRKSYKSIINKGMKEYSLGIVDAENPDKAAFDRYKELHHKASGRVTRSNESFELQYRTLLEDHAMLVKLEKDGDMLAASYFNHSSRAAFYGSASENPDCKDGSCWGHCLIWTAVQYYLKRGFSVLETGWQPLGGQLFEQPSEKELRIGFFKRGFGRKMAPLWRGVKYYDAGYMKDDLRRRAQGLAVEADG